MKVMFEKNSNEIIKVIDNYFQGIFRGDVDVLAQVFYPGAVLFGDVNGQPYLRSLEEYLETVRNRKSPYTLGEKFRMKILSVEILNGIAWAKLYTPMLGFDYYDVLSLNRINGQWLIVNKLFTHFEH